MIMDHSDTENIPEAMRFFQGKRGEPNETFEKLRDAEEKVAYLIAKYDIPQGNDVAEAIANYSEGISRGRDEPQAAIEKQIRKYLKERSWERKDGREPE
jgi:hypothetical protein